jgi:tRNA-modifying protein YgfZ
VAASDTASLDDDEYRTLVESCGLIDRSERGKLALSGAGAVEFLNGQITNELLGLQPGEGCYATFLTHKGKMLGDLRILAVGKHPGEPSELLLDTERVALQALFDMIRRFKVGYDVQLHKRTLETSLFSLVGPRVHELVARAAQGSLSHANDDATANANDDANDAATSDATADATTDATTNATAEHAHRPAHIAGRPVRLVSTAEPTGVDVLCEATERDRVWAALVAAGARPVSEANVEVLRVEHGRPRYGVDLDENTIPQEAGLNERAVSFTKGCYVGQETVARLHYRGKPNRHLRGLRLSRSVAPGAELHSGGRAIGRLSSSVLSPVFGPIGLGLVRREAEPGTTVTVDGSDANAIVIELPFK